MSDQITTAAELDALPVGSVVMTERTIRGLIADGADPIERRVWQKFGGLPDWQYGQPRHEWQAADGGFERTDCPQHLRGMWLYGSASLTVIYRPDAPARTEPTEAPQRVAPGERELAIWMHDNLGCSLDGCECADKFEYYRAEAHNLAALYASAPTVAEVKAEAWDECVRKIRYLSGSRWTGDDLPNPYRQEANHG